jgi:hypothetical protein
VAASAAEEAPLDEHVVTEGPEVPPVETIQPVGCDCVEVAAPAQVELWAHTEIDAAPPLHEYFSDVPEPATQASVDMVVTKLMAWVVTGHVLGLRGEKEVCV